MNQNPNSVIDDICIILTHQARFWGDGGWAPDEVRELLCKSRLDRQVGLARCLKLWIEPLDESTDDAKIILAWTNLGAIVEGSLMLFLTVHLHDYMNNPLRRNSAERMPAELILKEISDFFCRYVWANHENKIEIWKPWLDKLRANRNGIHAFAERTVDGRSEFADALIMFRKLLVDLENHIPYPEEYYCYPASVARICESVAGME